MGFPERGYAKLSEILEIKAKVSLTVNGQRITSRVSVERDKYFKPTHNLQTYAEAAHHLHRITTNPEHLNQAQIALTAHR